jgi:hypothetical protein
MIEVGTRVRIADYYALSEIIGDEGVVIETFPEGVPFPYRVDLGEDRQWLFTEEELEIVN